MARRRPPDARSGRQPGVARHLLVVAARAGRRRFRLRVVRPGDGPPRWSPRRPRHPRPGFRTAIPRCSRCWPTARSCGQVRASTTAPAARSTGTRRRAWCRRWQTATQSTRRWRCGTSATSTDAMCRPAGAMCRPRRFGAGCEIDTGRSRDSTMRGAPISGRSATRRGTKSFPPDAPPPGTTRARSSTSCASRQTSCSRATSVSTRS